MAQHPSLVRIMGYSMGLFMALAGIGLLLNEIRESRIYEHCGDYALCISAYTRRELGVLQWSHFAYVTSMIGLGTAIVGFSIAKLGPDLKKTTPGGRFFLSTCVALVISLFIAVGGFTMARAYDKGMGTTFQCYSEDFDECIAEHRRSLGILRKAPEVIRLGIVASGVSFVYVLVSGGMLAYHRVCKKVQEK